MNKPDKPVPEYPLGTCFRLDGKDVTIIGREWGPDARVRSTGWVYWVAERGESPFAVPEADLQKNLPIVHVSSN